MYMLTSGQGRVLVPCGLCEAVMYTNMQSAANVLVLRRREGGGNPLQTLFELCALA